LAHIVKFLFAIGLALLSGQLFAQRLSGMVVDKTTNLPVVHATVSIPAQTVFTTAIGQFSLSNVHKGDPVTVSCMGYKTYVSALFALNSDTTRIYLEPSVVSLKNVTIRSHRNANTDSINLRKQFASVFDYKKPTIMDAFITHSPYKYTPNDYITSTNNTTTLLSVNLLAVLDLLNRNNAPVSKLQKTLIKDEQYTYVDHAFSKQKVTEITHLKGDSLENFMDKYRPTVADARSMSDYEMLIYIKKSYREFETSSKK
jgi:hypothetical protein